MRILTSARAKRAAVLGAAVVCIIAALNPEPVSSQTRPAAPEPMLLHNGRILVAADAPDSTRWAQALLLSGGRVVAVGRTADVEREASRRNLRPRRVDLRGAFAMPGLTDAHAHLSGFGFSLQRLRLRGTGSEEEVAKMVREAATQRPKGEWIQGRAWDQNDWAVKRFPTKASLDRAAPDHPVWLRRVDGHAGWANSRALALAGITRDTQDPPGGRIHHDDAGEPTGVLIDGAMALVDKAVPAATDAQTREALRRAGQECARLGLTAVHDAGVSSADVEVYRAMAGAGELPIRVFAMLARGSARPEAMPEVKPSAGDGLFRVFGVKAYADGALGSRGAALLAPYEDEPANTGLLRIEPDSLEELAQLCLARGYSLATHAIGDRGNRMTLDAYERAVSGDAAKLRDKRFRIEHAQVVALDDIPRFAKLGVIASMQPTHCTSDMPWAPDRVGAARIEGAYAWRRMLDAGVRLALGSDFPVEESDPRLGLYAAVTTQDTSGQPAAGYRGSQRLTILETLRGFTSDAAYAAFAENEVGRLTPGMRADVTVFDRDLTAVPPKELLQARVVLTIVDGRVAWGAR